MSWLGNMEKSKEKLLVLLRKYINIISNDFNIDIKDCEILEDKIIIEDTGSISLFVRDGKIYLPLLAYEVIDDFKKNPNYGTNKGHKCYDDGNLICNDNTFLDYINHVIVGGLDAEEYFAESLLHETLHLCGSKGCFAIREGMTELLTRELALKYNLLTSGCGYYKEIEIANRLKSLFGEEVFYKIIFMNENEIYEFLVASLGLDAAEFYVLIRDKMEEEFYSKYYQYKFDNPYDKAFKYSEIDYKEVYDLIDLYESKIKKI